MSQSNPTILYIDDNQDNRELLAFAFELQGLIVKSVESVEEGFYQFNQENFSAVILDNKLGKISGLDVCKEIRMADPVIPIIFYSGEARQSEIEKALLAGANAYFVKPLDFSNLTETVARLVQETQVIG